MSLITDIQNIVNTKFPNATFILSSWFKANRESYNMETITTLQPLIVLNNELKKEKEIQQNANILSDTNVIIRVLSKGGDEVYTSDVDMNTDIEILENIADQIANNIYQLESIRLTGTTNQKYSIIPIFKAWNSVLIGVELDMRVKENQIRNWCKS
jgi:hypothetical protein